VAEDRRIQSAGRHSHRLKTLLAKQYIVKAEKENTLVGKSGYQGDDFEFDLKCQHRSPAMSVSSRNFISLCENYFLICNLSAYQFLSLVGLA
jgi:hypothetical protein